MVVFPSATGMPDATHAPVPLAVPVTPFEVCHVTRAMPAAAAAVPLTEMVDAVTVSTAAAGASMAMLTGELLWPYADAIVRKPYARIAEARQMFFMIFLSTKYFCRFTKIFRVVKMNYFERNRWTENAWLVPHHRPAKSASILPSITDLSPLSNEVSASRVFNTSFHDSQERV